MEELKKTTETLIQKMGFEDFSVSFDQDGGRLNILINDGKFLNKNLAEVVFHFNHLVRLITKKYGWESVVVDVNNYRKQRQDIIVELARAAARKAVATKQDIALPPMNAFERRIVHTELAGRPDIETESVGEEKDRAVVIKPI